MIEEATLFVFYSLPNDYWSYDQFPKDWKWIGKGNTFPVGCKKIPTFTHEEQFSGPVETQKEMIMSLNQTFKKLEKEKKIGFFKIQKTYE